MATADDAAGTTTNVTRLCDPKEVFLNDPEKTFQFDVTAELSKYLNALEARQSGVQNNTLPNFAEAALVLFNSTSVYSKKVDYLQQLAIDASNSVQYRHNQGSKKGGRRKNKITQASSHFLGKQYEIDWFPELSEYVLHLPPVLGSQESFNMYEEDALIWKYPSDTNAVAVAAPPLPTLNEEILESIGTSNESIPKIMLEKARAAGRLMADVDVVLIDSELSLDSPAFKQLPTDHFKIVKSMFLKTVVSELDPTTGQLIHPLLFDFLTDVVPAVVPSIQGGGRDVPILCPPLHSPPRFESSSLHGGGSILAHRSSQQPQDLMTVLRPESPPLSVRDRNEPLRQIPPKTAGIILLDEHEALDVGCSTTNQPSCNSGPSRVLKPLPSHLYTGTIDKLPKVAVLLLSREGSSALRLHNPGVVETWRRLYNLAEGNNSGDCTSQQDYSNPSIIFPTACPWFADTKRPKSILEKLGIEPAFWHTSSTIEFVIQQAKRKKSGKRNQKSTVYESPDDDLIVQLDGEDVGEALTPPISIGMDAPDDLSEEIDGGSDLMNLLTLGRNRKELISRDGDEDMNIHGDDKMVQVSWREEMDKWKEYMSEVLDEVIHKNPFEVEHYANVVLDAIDRKEAVSESPHRAGVGADTTTMPFSALAANAVDRTETMHLFVTTLLLASQGKVKILQEKLMTTAAGTAGGEAENQRQQMLCPITKEQFPVDVMKTQLSRASS